MGPLVGQSSLGDSLGMCLARHEHSLDLEEGFAMRLRGLQKKDPEWRLKILAGILFKCWATS